MQINTPNRSEKAKIGGIVKLICMAKVQNISEITPNIPFTEYNFYDLYRKTFENSELGRIKSMLPLREMASNFGLTGKGLRPKLGRKPFFTPEGKVTLMFLKMYTGTGSSAGIRRVRTGK